MAARLALNKTKAYEIAKHFLGQNLPKRIECAYDHCSDSYWLFYRWEHTPYTIQIFPAAGRAYIRLIDEHKGVDEKMIRIPYSYLQSLNCIAER